MTEAEKFLKGKTVKVREVNLAEPPGGTFKAVHASEMAELLEEYAKLYHETQLKKEGDGKKKPNSGLGGEWNEDGISSLFLNF